MKKSASKLFIVAVLLFSCFIGVFAARAAEPDQSIADANGYTVFETEDGEKFYADEDGFAPNVMVVAVQNKLDLTPYQNGTVTDFYGVEIVEITELGEISPEYPCDDQPDNTHEVAAYEYRIVTAEFYTYGQSKVLFANHSEVIYSGLVRLFTPDNYGKKPGDVNQNGYIDPRDYILLKRAYFGTFILTEQGEINGDINRNGKIDARDYILLKRIYFGTYNPDSTPDEATNDQA